VAGGGEFPAEFEEIAFEPAAAEEPKKPPASTLLGKGRGPKRHRRAL
jgi:hypothetical protein